MRLRLLSLLIAVGALTAGPATAASAYTPASTRTPGTITLPIQAEQLGRYWS